MKKLLFLLVFAGAMTCCVADDSTKCGCDEETAAKEVVEQVCEEVCE
jgi:hypothetical protein